MKRRLIGYAMFLPLLVCLLGASTISFDAGQPVPNPGGAKNALEGKGTFTIDPAETAFNCAFECKETKTGQLGSIKALIKENAWSGTLLLVAGNYDSWGRLTTKDKNGVLIFTKSTVENKKLK